MSDLKAVLFDYGDTLVSTRLDWKKVLPKSLTGLYRRMKSHVDSLDADRLGSDFLSFREAGKQRASVDNFETPATESLSKALAQQGIYIKDKSILQAGVDSFFEAEEQAYTVIAGIPETLNTLKVAGFKLAIISNATCGHLVRRALSTRHLLSYFDQVVISAEVGRCKPDPVIFHTALNAMGLIPRECVMVGDLLHTDVQGAKNTGILSILVNFFNDQLEIPPTGPQPDAMVKRPADLVQVIQGFSSSLCL